MSSEDIQKRYCSTCSQEFIATAVVCPHDGTLLTPVKTDPLIGTILSDRYKILSVAGTGGMGAVYKGMHMLMDRVVAIKMLHSHLITDANALQRFQQEARTACALTHPHIISLYDFGIAPGGQPFLVMEFLKGTSLHELIQGHGHLQPERILHIFIQACEALEHAHSHSVIHRDIKPSNIVLITDGADTNFVKIVDFGIAKLLPGAGRESMHLTQTGEVFGSPLYMSPEQCMAQKLDARTDIYSLGCVLYEALTGVPPLIGKHSVDTIQKHVNEMPRPLKYANPEITVPAGLEPVVFKALAKDPNQRYRTMLELKEDLEKISRHSRPEAALPEPAQPSESQNKAAADESASPVGQTEEISGPNPAVQASSVVITTPLSGQRRPILVKTILVSMLVAAGVGLAAWSLSEGLWYPPFVEPLVLWEWYQRAGESAFSQGRFAEAEKWTMMAIKAGDRLEEPKLRMTRSLNKMGEIYVRQAKYSDAEVCFEKALAIRDHAHSLANPDGIAIITNLAKLYEAEGKYSFAAMQYKQLIEHVTKMFGADDPEVAKARALLEKMQRKTDAGKVPERARKIEVMEQK